MLIISDGMRVPMRGDITVATVPALRKHLERIIQGGCKQVMLDFSQVDYIDSTGAALIITTGRKLRRAGGLLTLENVPENVLRTFTLWRLTDFIPIVSCSEAHRVVSPLPHDAVARWHLGIAIDASTLAQARDRLREMLETLPLSDEEIFDVTLAAGEAMGNAILHTPNGTGALSVTAYDDRVVIEAVDDGPGYSIAADEEPETTYEHGRGIKMMRMLVDAVDISKKRFGNGTVARLTKLFDAPTETTMEPQAMAMPVA